MDRSDNGEGSMITFVQCVRRREGLSDADFQAHWKRYAEEMQQIAGASRAIRCEVSRVLAVPQNLALMAHRATGEPFDGLVEISWRGGAEALEDVARPEVQGPVAAMQAHQEAFVDLKRSSFLFTYQEVAFDRS
jgi:hypothetical protein